MLKKVLLEEIIRGFPQGVVGCWKWSVKGNSNACKKGIILDMIQTRDLRKGNEPCLISPSDLIVVFRNESWRIYESKLMNWRLS